MLAFKLFEGHMHLHRRLFDEHIQWYRDLYSDYVKCSNRQSEKKETTSDSDEHDDEKSNRDSATVENSEADSPQPKNWIFEHIQKSKTHLENHIQKSKERFENMGKEYSVPNSD